MAYIKNEWNFVTSKLTVITFSIIISFACSSWNMFVISEHWMECFSFRLIDCFVVEPPVTSLTMSPTDTFLATTHVDDVGIYLWSNRTLYSGMVSAPLPPTQKPALMTLPATSGPRHGLRRITSPFDCIFILVFQLLLCKCSCFHVVDVLISRIAFWIAYYYYARMVLWTLPRHS